MLDGLLRDLYLLAQRGKELQPTQILAQCTKTGPPTLQLARFGHGALLLRSGNASWPRPFPSAIGFIGVRFARFSAVLKVLLPCAKNWQLLKQVRRNRFLGQSLQERDYHAHLVHVSLAVLAHPEMYLNAQSLAPR